MGPTWFLGNVSQEFVYYDKYADERSINGFYKGGWLVPFTRFTTQVNGSYLMTKDRPGFEIDERARRAETTVDGSIEVRALSRTFLGIRVKRRDIAYDESATFLQESLRVQLNRTVTEGAVTFRHELTPLTSFTVDVLREQARFPFAPLRDADSTQIVAGVKFDPYALLKGSATVGYRDFQPRVAGLPRYRGSTAAVDLTYLALVSTKITIRGTRDVQYSYDVNQPYYLQSGVSGEVMQKILGPLDIVGRAGFAALDYRDREGAEVLVSNRRDTVRLFGGGIGYRIGKDVRLGFNVDYQKRDSQVLTRQYEGLRCGTSVTYGL
jgi:hypothetical protein